MKAQFIGGQVFWDTFTAFRVCNIGGRYGAGKTSLAFLMAARLYAEKRVDKVVSNIPCRFAVNYGLSQDEYDLSYDEAKEQNNISVYKGIPVPLENAAIVLDESWIYIESRQDVLDYAAFVRKFEHFLLLPSVMAIHSRLSFFRVQRVFNAYTVGLPMWFYKWSIRDKDIKEHGYFGIYNPKAIFGYYPTKFVAGDDGGISDVVALTSKKAGFKGTRKNQRPRLSSAAKTSIDIDLSTALEDSAEDIQADMALMVDDIRRETKKAVFAIRR